jgi:hypothetical protein
VRVVVAGLTPLAWKLAASQGFEPLGTMQKEWAVDFGRPGDNHRPLRIAHSCQATVICSKTRVCSELHTCGANKLPVQMQTRRNKSTRRDTESSPCLVYRRFLSMALTAWAQETRFGRRPCRWLQIGGNREQINPAGWH